jgi:DNA-binding SARP family transcriptional activator
VIRAAEEAERLLPRNGNLVRRATCLRLRARAIYESRGDVQEAERLILKAVRLLEQSEDRFTLAVVLADLLFLQDAQGKPLEAQATRLRAHQILERIGSPQQLALSFNNLAVSAHLEGRYDEALDLFLKGIKLAHRAANMRYEAAILYGQADLFCDLGLPLQAAALYEQGLILAARLGNVDLLRYGYTQTSVLHRRCGTGTLPHEWLERARTLDSGKERPAAVDIQLAALSIAASPSSATRRLTEILRQQMGRLRANEKALILCFLAQAALAGGNREEGRGHLVEALAWACDHGAEQALAGEMMYHQGIREFARQEFEGNPHLAVVLQRVDVMRAMGRMYEEKSDMPSKKRQLLVKAFGPSELRFEGRRVSDLEPLPKQLLFFLTDRKDVERDVLLEAFWPDSPPGRQVSSLYTAIHSLRRALSKDVVRIEGSVYAVNSEYVIEYDVAEFEHASSVAMGMPPGDPRRFFALTEAVNVCSGSFLPEYASEWVVGRRRELEGCFLQLLTLHAEEALAHGQPQQAVNSFRQALQIDPLRDDINLHYLEVLGQLGRRSEAVGHYRQYVHRLADELGLDPPESLREVYARLIH